MIDAYVKDGKLQKWLKTQGISGSVWITNCKTGKGYVVNGTQTTASTTSKTQADAIVNDKKFNGDIGISACYDPDTKQWTINHSFKDGVLKPPSKYAGELEKLKATSDQYVENVIKKKNAEANKTPGTGSSAAVGTDPDFKYADLGILEAVLMVKDFTKQIVNTAKVPEEYWDETKPEYQTSPVHAPALFCGAGDQGLEEATELVQLLDLGLTIATEPETASKIWTSIKNVKWEDVKKMAGNASGYENYAKGGCYAKYQGGKHGVSLAMAFFAITKAKSISEILSDLDDNLKKAGKAVDDVAEILARVLKKLQKKLDELSIADQKLFKADLEKVEFLKYLDEVPDPEKIVDAWKVMNIDAELRKNLEADDLIAYKLKQSGLSPDELQKSFKQASDKKQWVEDISDEVGAKARNLPGMSGGNGSKINGDWLKGTEGNLGLFPESIANQLKGKTFNSFAEFRQSFWKAVSEDPNLTKQFNSKNINLMRKGKAPIPIDEQWLGEQGTYILHHKTPIHKGGSVYDVDNIIIVTPRYHKEILDVFYHFGH